jgi:hypothetical protein
MKKLSFSAGIKLRGNINRMQELTTQGHSAEEVRNCFRSAGVHLQVANGDFPLLANLSELTRTAVPKSVVKMFLRSEGSSTAGWEPMPA